MTNQPNEEWRTCSEFPNYEVSSIGNVRHSIKFTLMHSALNHAKYPCVTLREGGKHHRVKVHRLVAMEFCDISLGNEVNHLDGNKENNRFENLEWCSRSKNLLHSYRVLGRVHSEESRAIMSAVNSGHNNHGSKHLFLNGEPTTCLAISKLCGRCKSSVAALIGLGYTPEEIVTMKKYHRKKQSGEDALTQKI